MKKIYPLLTLLICLQGYSQSNFKPADSLSLWTGLSYATVAPGTIDFERWYSVYTKESNYDTLIGSNTYSKLYQNSTNNLADEIYYCAFRSDTLEKALYIMPRDSSEEYLFFDFDADYTIGDTLAIPMYGCDVFFEDAGFTVSEMKLSSIDSVLIDDEYFTYCNFEEGVDSTCGIIPINHFSIMERMITRDALPFTWTFSFETIRDLKCYSENGTEFYGSKCPYTYEHFLDMEESKKEQKNQSLVYPNPSAGNFTLNITVKELQEVNVFNLQGEKVHSEWVVGNSPSLKMNNVESGNYIVIIVLNGEIRTERIIIR